MDRTLAVRQSVILSLCTCIILCSSALAQDGLRSTSCGSGVHDLVMGNISAVANYNAEEYPTGSGVMYDAVAVGTADCNMGQATLAWEVPPSVREPLFGFNLFRLAGGRIEQLGQGWVHRGFVPLQAASCCTCTQPPQSNMLGIGCTNNDTASINGQQTATVVPKWQITAFTGQFPGSPAVPASTGGMHKRMKAKIGDLTVPGALYFAEVQVIHFEEETVNKSNNASYRQLTVTGNASNVNFAIAGLTSVGTSAIFAWQQSDPQVLVSEVSVPDQGLLYVAARAFDLGGGHWRYEYAVQNLNFDRAIASFSVPVQPGTVLSNIGFHDVDYLDGDGISSINRDGTDWPTTTANGAITWSVASFDDNANALRWGTLYNFHFEADAAPCDGSATMGVFGAGLPSTLAAASVIPGCFVQIPGDHNHDGQVTVDDQVFFADCMSGPDTIPAPTLPGATRSSCTAAFDLDDDDDVDLADFRAFAELF